MLPRGARDHPVPQDRHRAFELFMVPITYGTCRNLFGDAALSGFIMDRAESGAGKIGTSGWSMPGEGSSYKRFVGHYTGYNNTTATAQAITYPVEFSLTPKITSNDGPSGSTSTTALTLPASMGSTVTGWIIVEGY